MIDFYLSDDNDYSDWRDVVNAEIMYELYNRTGNEDIKRKCIVAYNHHDGKETSLDSLLKKTGPIDEHGVTFMEILKLPLMCHYLTGFEFYKTAALNGMRRVEEYTLSNGMYCANEYFMKPYSTRGTETCNIVDYFHTLNYFYLILGDQEYLARMRWLAKNIYPSLFTDNHKKYIYCAAPNQVACGENTNSTDSFVITNRGQYARYHYPRCCCANITRFEGISYGLKQHDDNKEKPYVLERDNSCIICKGETLYTLDIKSKNDDGLILPESEYSIGIDPFLFETSYICEGDYIKCTAVRLDGLKLKSVDQKDLEISDYDKEQMETLSTLNLNNRKG